MNEWNLTIESGEGDNDDGEIEQLFLLIFAIISNEFECFIETELWFIVHGWIQLNIRI